MNFREFLDEVLVESFGFLGFDRLADIEENDPELFDKFEKGTEEFIESIDQWFEFASYGQPSYRDIEDQRESEKVRRLKAMVESLEKEVEVYRNSVKIRRNTDQVWVEGDRVMYQP